MFRFRCAPLRDHPLCGEFLSEQTLRSMERSDWVRTYSDQSKGEPEVYLAEAYGGASMQELVALCSALGASGKYVIMVSTADVPFPPIPPGCLLFEVMAPAPRTCTYGWEAHKYGPDRLDKWKPFSERKILASFVGSRRTHVVREILFEDSIKGHPGIVVEDIDWWSTFAGPEGHEKRVQLSAHFGDVLEDSKFAFCPRGNGPSSKRRWESAYCGAIPILMEDVSRPFGVQVPLLNFRPQAEQSTADKAVELLELLYAALPNGQDLQDQLSSSLAKDFDATAISPIHTTVGHIIDVANRMWVVGKGFQSLSEA